VTIQNLEQLDQRERRLGLAVLVPPRADGARSVGFSIS
jgi:hypothetical protein